tara:strand:- start:19866 stop:20351 length:486 start_codon:yes stop_codon:yes gene_type:complete
MADYVPNERKIKLEGFAEFEAQLLALGNGMRSDLAARATMAKAAKIAMEPVYTQVATTAPYDEKSTGPIHLRDTVRLESRIPSNRDKSSNYVNESDAVIAVVSVKKSAVSLANEFGTKNMAAQPFLRRALDSNVDNVLTILKSQLGAWIPAYAAKLARQRK